MPDEIPRCRSGFSGKAKRDVDYRTKDLDTMIRKAVSGGCEGVLQLEVDPRYAAARG